MALIWQTVAVNDALGAPLFVVAAEAATPFQFRSDPEGQIEDFMDWLNGAIDDEVLDVSRGPGGRITSNDRWQEVYVRSSYSRGLDHANDALARAGVSVPAETVQDLFNAPNNAESLARLYSRSFNELQGISQATSQRVGRVLTEGLATGQGPREIARNMRKAVSTIGKTRSVTLARTEVINAHATATLNRYADVGLTEVIGQAEFLTARDDRVCQECLSLETGPPFSLDDAKGVIPVHPNCRCVWLPVI
tara:strand:- start:1278 stop:2027 length:750 start_codon:yes stop_codon:yes gene_type:complete